MIRLAVTRAVRLPALVAIVLVASGTSGDDALRPVPLVARVSDVQPMTGIVLWTTNPAAATAPIQLEFAYVTYRDVVDARGDHDWMPVERLLADVAGRGHQAIIRWHDTYVGRPSGIPDSIRSLPGYRETTGRSEGKKTAFPDWSHPRLGPFVLDFFTQFAARFDADPRLAFVQVGFGLWSEYHIYDGPMRLGETFPSHAFQAEFARHLATRLVKTPWMISVDAAGDQAPFASDATLRGLRFGVFDDSFNHARHREENQPNWEIFGRDRWQTAPAGGEFAFFETADQAEALADDGPHGVPFAAQAARFHVSFIIGDDQPRFRPPGRIRQAGLACGYRFRVTRFVASDTRSEVTLTNTGIAPIYHDAYPAVNGSRAEGSLAGLLPGGSRTFTIPAGGAEPALTIESDRLVPGQRIGYDADLP